MKDRIAPRTTSYNNAQAGQPCLRPAEMTAAEEVADLIMSIKSRMPILEEDFFRKFGNMLKPEAPLAMPEPVRRELPEYFEGLRDNLLAVDRCLERLFSGINRADI